MISSCRPCAGIHVCRGHPISDVGHDAFFAWIPGQARDDGGRPC